VRCVRHVWLETTTLKHSIDSALRGLRFLDRHQIPEFPYSTVAREWLGSRVVSVLDSGAEGPGSNRSRDAVG